MTRDDAVNQTGRSDSAPLVTEPAVQAKWVHHRLAPVKRAADIAMAALLMVPAAPVMLAVAAALRLASAEPVLFRQKRAGRFGRPFTLYKFRSMCSATHRSGRVLSDSERLTPLGRFLRRTSLDELPQLFNVLKGDVSIVGPRPLLVEYVPRYTAREQLRHSVWPGITGWAQVHGRQTLPFSRRLELDVWYVEHWSLLLDTKILLMTVPKVLGAKGVVLEQTLAEVDDRGLADGLGLEPEPAANGMPGRPDASTGG